MKKLTKILSVILSVLMVASVIPAINATADGKIIWTSSFEDGADGWTSIDADADGHGWEHRTSANGANFSGKDSSGCMYSESYYIAGREDLAPENYLVSPEVELKDKFHAPVLNWYAGAADDRYFLEHYSVYVYAGEDELNADNVKSKTEDASVSKLIFSETLQSNVYTNAVAEIGSSYIGETVRFVFVHHESSGESGLKIDEVSVLAAEKIEAAQVTDIKAPEVGKTPDKTAEIALTADGEDAEYASYEISWQQKAADEEEWSDMNSASFKTELSYRVCIDITASEKYIFSDALETATINGENAEKISDDTIVETVTLAYEWAPMYQITWDLGNGFKKSESYSKGETPVEPDGIVKDGKIFAGWEPEVPETVTENATFTAVWEDEVYTVIWDVDGVTTSAEYKYGDEIEVPEDPEKEFYDFTGWTPEVPETMPDIGTTGDSVTYSATWALEQYTVTWVSEGLEDYVVTYGYGEAVEYYAPERAGYTFVGWDKDVPDVMPAENLVFTASWTPLGDTKYTVNIHTMKTDGEYETATEVLEGKTEENVTAVYEIEEGFVLGENSVTSGAILGDGSLVLDVYLNRKTVTLSFDSDGGSDVESVVQIYGSDVTAPEAPEKAGYVFTGWDNEIPAVMPAEDMSFKATWIPAENTKYTVNIHTMNADGEYETETKELEGTTEETVKAEYTVPEGFVFNDEKSVSEGSVAADGTLVLDVYLDRKTVELTFDPANGEEAVTVSGLYGAEVEIPENFEKTGHSIIGWEPEVPAVFPVENGSFKAVWEVNEYTITFKANGGKFADGKDEAVIRVAYGADVTIPEYPSRIGYTFTGWDYKVPAVMTAENLTVNAQWTDAERNVEYYSEGILYAIYNLAEGDEFAVPESPEKEGYTFSHWSFTEGGDAAEIPETMPAPEEGAVISFYAVFTANEYTLTWDVDGELTKVGYDFGETIEVIASPEKEGYTFVEWLGLVEKMPAADVTVTAQWSANEYEAVFNSDEGAFEDGTTSKTVATKFGEIPVAPAIPVKEGYIFKGWHPELKPMGVEGATYTAVYTADEVNYTVDVYTMGTDGEYGEPVPETHSAISDSTVTIVPEEKEGFAVDTELSVIEGVALSDGSLVLSVYYSRNQYDFIMDVDGETTTEKIYFDADITAPESPEKEGYSFAEWEGLVEKMPAGEVTVKATWEIESYTIKFDTDGAGEIPEITAEYGAPIEIPADPEKEGYTFDGWDEEIPETMADFGENGAEKVFTATWKANEYTVTWVVDGKETVEKYKYGEEIKKIADPVKDGYVFSKWSGEIPETMPAKNLVFTALWLNAKDTQYKVLVYRMKTDGTYAEPESSIKTGETGATVSTDYTVPTGFVFNAEKSVTSGVIKADGSLALKIYLDRKSVTITFDTNGGTAMEPLTGLYGADVVIENITEKTGYSVKEWEGYTATFPLNDVTFKAVWEINTYTVTFKNIGLEGNADLVVEYVYGDKIVPPEVKVGEGSSFVGWDKEIPETMPAENLVFSARKAVNKYNVTFDANGGQVALADGTMAEKRVNSVLYNASVKIPAEPPVKQGYIFGGWEGYKQGMKMPARDLTFVAKWTPAPDTKYTVKTHTMGLDGKYVTNTEYFTAETDSSVFAKYTVGEGFIVNKNSVTSGKVAADGSLVLEVYLDRKLVTINFDTKGGSEVPAVTQLYGTAFSAPASPVREGYTFAGWDREIPSTMPAASVIIYAEWTLNSYTAVYSAEGGKFADGSDKKTVNVDFGKEVIAPETPERAGYTFNGWTGVPATMPANNVEIKASWKANTYDAVFKSNGGKFADGASEIRVATVFNEQIIAPADPVRAGYIFDGWNVAVGTMTTVGGCTFEAKWKTAKDTKYTVNIYTMGTDGNYVKQTSTLAGETGAVVNANYSVSEGFELSKTKNNVTSGTIAADGSLVLEVYLDRKLVTITFDTKGGSAVESITRIYGSKVTAPESPVKKGYKFAGWKNLPSTMPATDMTVQATYVCSATVSIKNNTGSITINYGDTLRLTAVVNNLPENTAICWYVDGIKRGEGETFDITFESGTKTVSVKLVDRATNTVLENEYGTEIGDMENVSVNAGFFQKIISFFKNLFGSNRTVTQLFRKF